MRWIVFLLLFIVSGSDLKAQSDLCLSEDELALGNLINKLRSQQKLEVIPWSASLTYVADVHVKDLYLNHDPFGKCNLLAWSDQGRWKTCCPDKKDLSCMHDKPFELIDYKSKGYELVFYANTDVTSGLAFESWQQTEAAKNLMLQQGRYAKKQWNAMGIAIFEGYVSVWFGQLIDEAGEPLTCKEASENPKVSDDVTEEKEQERENLAGYFVVVASRKTKKDAEREVENREGSAYEFKVIKSDNNFRVVSGPHQGYSQALIVKQKLSDGKNKPWIWNANEK